MMTSREQFETAWKKNNECEPMDGWESLRCDDGYTDEAIDGQWWAWQASREAVAVAVELPDKKFISEDEALIPEDSDWPDGFNTALEQCAEVIRAAGIKIT